MTTQDIKNDQALSDAVFHITQLGRKLQELLRDGKWDQLDAALGVVNKSSERGIYRLNDLRFSNSKLPAAYQKQHQTPSSGT